MIDLLLATPDRPYHVSANVSQARRTVPVGEFVPGNPFPPFILEIHTTVSALAAKAVALWAPRG